MPLQVTSDNLEITPSMQNLAETKVSKIFKKLEDLPEDLVDIRVVLNKGEGEDTFVVKVQFDAGGKVVVGEDFEYNLESALIKAVDDALRQYEKDKDKKGSEEWKKRRGMKVYQYRKDA